MSVFAPIVATVAGSPVLLFLLFVVCFFGMGGFLSFLNTRRRMVLDSRENIARIETQREIARALGSAPEEAQRNELARQLLEAYGEAGEGLRNDEKGSLRRWEVEIGR